jgi:serine/threonine-protein kinase HipA
MNQLSVRINGAAAGTWSVVEGVHKFSYHQSWLSSPTAVPISRQLPLSGADVFEGHIVRNFFDNLLPDNSDIRARIGERAGVDGASTFALLHTSGGDCAGGVQVVDPVAQHATAPYCEVRNVDSDLNSLVPALADRGWWPAGDIPRWVVAGAQEKVALAKLGTSWALPSACRPSTHIIKLPLGLIGGARRVDASDSAENEWLCAEILRLWGFSVAATDVVRFGADKVLVVERFDRVRTLDGDVVERRHQEDFCQALGLPPDLKYESDGGPGIAACLELLRESADKRDGSTFLLAQLAFSFLGATDGHAKNFSIFHEPGGVYRLSPLYDVLSIWPYVGNAPNRFNARKSGPAMVIRSKNVHRYFNTILARHWQHLALEQGGQALWDQMIKLAERAPHVLEAMRLRASPAIPGRTFAAIADGVMLSTKRFLREIGHEV